MSTQKTERMSRYPSSGPGFDPRYTVSNGLEITVKVEEKHKLCLDGCFPKQKTYCHSIDGISGAVHRSAVAVI